MGRESRRKAEQQARYFVRNPDVERELRNLGRLLKQSMPDGWGFTLLMFNYGVGEKLGDGLFYLSSANREDMIATMREFIAKEEGRYVEGVKTDGIPPDKDEAL